MNSSTHIFTAALVVIAGVSGCGDSADSNESAAALPGDPAAGRPISANLGTPLSLSIDQRGSYPDLGLELVPISLNDSRCPTGTTCVWAGDCAVTLVAYTEGEADTLVLHTSGRMDQSLPLGENTVTLLDVSPYPKDGGKIAISDYVISIDATPPDES